MAISRRVLLQGMAASALVSALPPLAWAQASTPLMRPVPSSGELIPAVGLGTWITFNVGEDAALRDECAAVMEAFFKAGGRVIDSSPMYGSAQAVVGHGLERLGRPETLFSADKVWISDGAEGRAQVNRSRRLWNVPRFDLMQVHNLLGWEAHLETLGAMKAAKEIRYVGITTSEGRRHDLFERVMESQPLDFVQISYNPLDREVEQRILPLALERGIAVMVNRPFRQGALTRRLAREKLPGWAAEVGAESWAQLILKFILAHPAVTVAIPATTQPSHARENVLAASDPLPDAKMRERIAAHIRDI
ncbi:MAG: aldo/keto reductase [Oceanibaculum sp.]